MIYVVKFVLLAAPKVTKTLVSRRNELCFAKGCIEENMA